MGTKYSDYFYEFWQQVRHDSVHHGDLDREELLESYEPHSGRQDIA